MKIPVLIFLVLLNGFRCSSIVFPDFTDTEWDQIIANTFLFDSHSITAKQVKKCNDPLSHNRDGNTQVSNECAVNNTKSAVCKGKLGFKEQIIEVKLEIKWIIEQQHPGTTNFCLKNYSILNWPEDVDQTLYYWNKKELRLIRDRLSELVFMPKSSKNTVAITDVDSCDSDPHECKNRKKKLKT